ncbi:diacylglycerol kinase family protein [Cellulomonas sp. URHE0023]|uniref:diacylglycerol/lipid kinase family protein n=1 Tax=Cellulomonas sp. URHE0023 TaxID=1380354 RepID=UPI00068E8C9D|nr:diacylglycerol kinase family protein [Cellulomonas sp. URHE0023]
MSHPGTGNATGVQRHARHVADRAPKATHPVLLMNPRSGGGKMARFRLDDRCRDLGVQPIVLGPGDDLLTLAEAAVAQGCDLLGMAGGDGSQALVATVAARHRIPFVVVPAGTRNNFARDLGVGTGVVGSLAAFVDGVDLRVDLAEVNGRVFVNNASMGAYAQLVRSPRYRDAKVRTAVELLPDLVGPSAASVDLRYALPGGGQATTAHVLLVSNNPYDLSASPRGARPRLDAGLLGVASVHVLDGAEAKQLAALAAAGHSELFSGWNEWTTTQLDVTSGQPIALGIDGEAVTLDPPLTFVSRPGALVVRIARERVQRRSTPSAVGGPRPVPFSALSRLLSGRGGHA